METQLICNTSARRSDTCEMKGDVRIQGNSSTIYVFTPNAKNASWTIKPYARKGDNGAMESVTNFTIKSVQKQAKTMPNCTQSHNVPAVVFSVAGYSGNSFHSFSDIIIPLYTTSRKFNREVQFLVVNKISHWNIKFKEVLDKLSRFEMINIDHENEVHCFPSMIVGLRKDDRKELYMDSMMDFTNFLRSSYSLERSTAIKLTRNSSRRPRLLIISRKQTRAFTNVNDVVLAAKELGFEVIVTEMSPNMAQVSRLVNSCDVMMGVHGAGLTNMVFLPENAVVIQVVPLGNMNWMAKTFYEEPSKAMRLKYLEYKIREGESTLIDQYPLNHQVFKDPSSIQGKGWEAYKSVYMDKQNVKLDIIRFREIFSKALELLH
ncbi:alpha-1,3-arabinosyltransferase XAT2 [Tanacetum coccineum]